MFKLLTNGDPVKTIKKYLGPTPSAGFYSTSDMSIGKWQFKRFNLAPCAGYFSDRSPLGRGVALTSSDTTWMSITPMEMESHLIAQYSAKGKVVVAGLGLGMIALSLLEKKEVTQLIVLEYDQDLIDGFCSILSGKSLKSWQSALDTGRLIVCQCDCKTELPLSIGIYTDWSHIEQLI